MPSRCARGSSLLEAVIAAALLATVLTGVLPLVTTAVAGTTAARADLVAAHLARQRLAQLQALTHATLPSGVIADDRSRLDEAEVFTPGGPGLQPTGLDALCRCRPRHGWTGWMSTVRGWRPARKRRPARASAAAGASSRPVRRGACDCGSRSRRSAPSIGDRVFRAASLQCPVGDGGAMTIAHAPCLVHAVTRGRRRRAPRTAGRHLRRPRHARDRLDGAAAGARCGPGRARGDRPAAACTRHRVRACRPRRQCRSRCGPARRGAAGPCRARADSAAGAGLARSAGTAWADRLSLVHVEARAAQAPFAAAVPAGSPVVHRSPGIPRAAHTRRADSAAAIWCIVYSRTGAMVIAHPRRGAGPAPDPRHASRPGPRTPRHRRRRSSFGR